MKARALLSFLVALFVYLFWLPTRAFAQVLPAASAPSDGIPAGAIILGVAVMAGLAAVGYVIWKRKHPAAANDLAALLHKAHDTIATQAQALASKPPVTPTPQANAVPPWERK